MIKHLEVENFKSLKRLSLDFRALTFLVGMNGSGKSSLIQMLLLLKAGAASGKSAVSVKLKNDWMDLGFQSDVFYRWAERNRMDFSIEDAQGERYSAFSEMVAAEAGDDSVVLQKTSENDERIFRWLRDDLRYLSADRVAPMSHHLNSAADVKSLTVGRRGESAVAILSALADHPVDPAVCHEVQEGQVADQTLKGQVDAWMKEIAFGAAISTHPNGDQIDVSVSFGKGRTGQGFRPENVGFGISYVLPVIVLLLIAPKGTGVIIENPEAHLHPRGQSALGRLMAKVAASGVQVIVETHSDHVINGVRVAVKKSDLLPEDVRIYFSERKESETADEVVEQYTDPTLIEFTKDGELTAYPKDFLDEWTNQLKELWG